MDDSDYAVPAPGPVEFHSDFDSKVAHLVVLATPLKPLLHNHKLVPLLTLPRNSSASGSSPGSVTFSGLQTDSHTVLVLEPLDPLWSSYLARALSALSISKATIVAPATDLTLPIAFLTTSVDVSTSLGTSMTVPSGIKGTPAAIISQIIRDNKCSQLIAVGLSAEGQADRERIDEVSVAEVVAYLKSTGLEVSAEGMENRGMYI